VGPHVGDSVIYFITVIILRAISKYVGNTEIMIVINIFGTTIEKGRNIILWKRFNTLDIASEKHI
jgi:hypothetical protein